MSDFNDNNISEQPFMSSVPTPDFEIPPQPVQYQQPQFSQPTNGLSPKKGKKKVVGIVATVAGVAVIGGVAVFAGPKIVDVLSGKSKLAPLDRFKNAIQSVATDYTDSISKANISDHVLASGNVECKTDFKLTLGDSIMAMIPEEYASLNNLTGNVDFTAYEDQVYTNIKLGVSGKTAASAELYLDTEEAFFLRIPELSPAFLSAKLEDLQYRVNTSSLSMPEVDPKKFIALIESESSTFLDSIKEVDLEEDVTIKVADTSSKYDKLTTSLSGEEFGNTIYNCFKRLTEEPAFAEMYKSFAALSQYDDFDMPDVQEVKDSLLSEIKDWADNNEVGVKMELYLDDDDNITGFVFRPITEEVDVSFGLLSAKSKSTAYNFFVKEDDQDLIRIYGNYKKSGNAYSGDATLDIYDEGIAKASIKLTFDEFTSTKDSCKGTITLSSPQLNGVSFSVSIDGKKDTGSIVFKVNMSTLNMVEFAFNYSIKAVTSCPTLPNNVTVYDVENINEYIYTLDTEGFIKNFEDVTGLDLSSLIDEF